MCYYKLDYYDVSLEILAVYLQAHPDSAIGVNLKACNHFRLYNGKAAEAELRVLIDKGVIVQGNELIRHNMAVFSNGDQALQVLPGLLDSIPEARLNLVSHLHLLRCHRSFLILLNINSNILSHGCAVLCCACDRLCITYGMMESTKPTN
jgi:hypothetical protein